MVERLLGLLEIFEPLLQFRTIDLSGGIKAGVLNGCGGGDGKQFGTPEVVLGKVVRFQVADGKKS